MRLGLRPRSKLSVRAIAFGLVATFLPFAPAHGATEQTFPNQANAPIPTQGTLMRTVSASNVGRILDVDIFVQISHGNSSHLAVRLIHPDGITSALLIDHRCGAGSSFDLSLDDEAATPISSQTGNCGSVLQGSFQPEQALAVFDDTNLLGTWTLEIVDSVSGTGGTLFFWSMKVLYELKSGTILRCNFTDFAIPDGGEATSTIVSGESVSLGDLDVEVDVAHPTAGDLSVSLRAPDLATEADLLVLPGACNGFDLTLNDEAAQDLPGSCSEGAAVTGFYRPTNPLTAFDGLGAAGTWELTVADLAVGDTGTLREWCLSFDFGIFRDGFEESGDTRYWSFSGSD